MMQAAKPSLCRTSSTEAVPTTFDTAFKLATAAAYDRVASAAAVQATLQRAPAAQQQAVAAAGMASGRPQAALAALLAAHQRAPKDPTPLVNAAAALNPLNRPGLSLAFLEHAATLGAPTSPMGWDGRAIALTNRGYALLLLGRWAQAEAPLREALTRTPLLAEARANLSWSLLCQGRDRDAAQQYRLGLRRAPSTTRAGDRDVPFEEPEDGATAAPESLPVRREAPSLFDLRAAKDGVLPDLKSPASVQEASGVVQAVLDRQRAVTADLVQSSARRDALQGQAEARLESFTGVTRRRAETLLYAIEMADFEPPVRDALKQLDAAEGDLTGQLDEPLLTEATTTRIYEILSSPGEEDAKRQAVRAVCLPDLEQHYVRLKERLHTYDQAARAYVRVGERYRSGLATNLHDPVLHALADAMTQVWRQGAFGNLVGMDVLVTSAAAGLRQSACLADPAPPVAQVVAAVPDASTAACPDELRGLKVALEWEVLSVSMTCEDVELSVSSAGPLGAFGRVNKAFLGSTTVVVGVRAGAAVPVVGAGASAEAGVYVTVDHGGTLQDAGVRASAGAGLSLSHTGGPLSLSRDVIGVGGSVSLGLVSGLRLE